MRNNALLLSILSLALTSCDLTEAQRMDITRQKVRGVAPEIQGISFFGRQEVSIDTLMGLAPGLPPDEVWKVVVGDSGSPRFNGGDVRGWWRDSLIFDAPLTGTGTWGNPPASGEWMRHPSEMRLEVVLYRSTYTTPSNCMGCMDYYVVQTDTFPSKWISSPVFRQDYNELHWDTTFSKKSPRAGDTLRLKVGVDRGSPGRSDSMPVFADYSGLRTVGDYVRYLKPSDTATLSWVVTSPAGDTIQLDLGWGTFGEAHTFGFRVAR